MSHSDSPSKNQGKLSKNSTASTLRTNTVLREINYLCYRLFIGQPDFGDVAMHFRKCFLNDPNLLPQSSSSDVIPLQDIDYIYRDLPNDFLLTIIKAGYESLCNSHPEIQTGSLLLPDMINLLMKKRPDSGLKNDPLSHRNLIDPYVRLLGLQQHRRLRTGIVGTEFFGRMALRRSLMVHRRRITALINDRNGKHFITAALDGVIKIWDRSTLTLRHSILACPFDDGSLKSLDVSLDNRIIVSSGHSMLKFWNLRDGSLMHSISGLVENVIFSNIVMDERRWIIYSCSNGDIWSCCYRWDDQAQIPAIFDDPVKIGRSDAFARNERPPIVQSTNGTFLGTGFADGSIHVYCFDADNCCFILAGEFLKYHDTKIRFLSFCGNGPAFVCGSDDVVSAFDFQSERRFSLVQKIKIISDGPSILKRKRPAFTAAVLCFGDTKLAAVIGSSLVLLNLLDGETDYIEKLPRGRWHSIESCPANRDVLVIAGDDGALQLHRATNGRLLKDLSFPRIKKASDSTALINRAIIKTLFSSCGSHLSAIDVQGRMHAFSLIPRALYENDSTIPYQYFFHWELSDVDFDNRFRPMYTNIPTQLLMENLPPPYVVDLHGDPHSAQYQKLVPGREMLHEDNDLLPTKTESNNLTGTKVVDDGFFTDENREGIFSDMRNPRKNYLTESLWKSGHSICLPVEVHECHGTRCEWESLATAIGVYDDQGPEITYDYSLVPTDVSTENRLVLGLGNTSSEHFHDPTTSETEWRPRRCGLRQRPRVTLRYDAGTLPHSAMMSPELAGILSDHDEEGDPDWSNPAVERLREPIPLPPRRDGRPRRSASYRVRIPSRFISSVVRRRRRMRTVEDTDANVEEEEEPEADEENDEDEDEGDQESELPSADVTEQESVSLLPGEDYDIDDRELKEQYTDDSRMADTIENDGMDSENTSSLPTMKQGEVDVVQSESADSSTHRYKDEERNTAQSSLANSDAKAEDVDEALEAVEEGEEEEDEEEEEKEKGRPVKQEVKKEDSVKENESGDDGDEEIVSEEESSEPESDTDPDFKTTASMPSSLRRTGRLRKRARKRKQVEELETENKVLEQKKRRVSDDKENNFQNAISPAFYPPVWMTDILPWPNRCVPQKGEVIVYHKVGHSEYLRTVKEVRNECGSLIINDDDEFHRKFRVVETIFKTLETGDRVCDTYLCSYESNDEATSIPEVDGSNLDDFPSVRYEDMDGVLSYLTPERLFDDAVAVNWKIGDRCRAIIDDNWWYGSVIHIDVAAIDAGNYWLCLRVRWTNSEEEEEAISPWDLFPVYGDDEPEDLESKDVQAKELPTMLPEDWWGSDGYMERVKHVMKKVIQLPESRDFKYPVDFEYYPAYLILVTYPMDLDTIERRLINKYYRTQQAFLSDCQLLRTNAIAFNVDGSEIISRANFVTSVLQRVLETYDFNLRDVEREAQSARSVLLEDKKVDTKRNIRRKKPAEPNVKSRSSRNINGRGRRQNSSSTYSLRRPVRHRSKVDYTDFISDDFDDVDSGDDCCRPHSRRGRRRGKKRSSV